MVVGFEGNASCTAFVYYHPLFFPGFIFEVNPREPLRMAERIDGRRRSVKSGDLPPPYASDAFRLFVPKLQTPNSN